MTGTTQTATVTLFTHPHTQIRFQPERLRSAETEHTVSASIIRERALIMGVFRGGCPDQTSRPILKWSVPVFVLYIAAHRRS
jgi:hypothetical protein